MPSHITKCIIFFPISVPISLCQRTTLSSHQVSEIRHYLTFHFLNSTSPRLCLLKTSHSALLPEQSTMSRTLHKGILTRQHTQTSNDSEHQRLLFLQVFIFFNHFCYLWSSPAPLLEQAISSGAGIMV